MRVHAMRRARWVDVRPAARHPQRTAIADVQELQHAARQLLDHRDERRQFFVLVQRYASLWSLLQQLKAAQNGVVQGPVNVPLEARFPHQAGKQSVDVGAFEFRCHDHPIPQRGHAGYA